MALASLVISLALSSLIIWWFFGKKSREETAIISGDAQKASITVDGGYQPEVTILQTGIPTRISFLRKDHSSCLEEVVFPDLGIQRGLTIDQKTTIDIPSLAPGEYSYSCGMRMFHGKLLVK